MADIVDNPEEQSGYIFISFDPKDRKKIKPILLELEEQNINVWYAGKEYSGSEYRRIVTKKVRGADALVAFLTKASHDSHQVDNEIHAAAEAQKMIIPVYNGVSFEDQPNSFNWCLLGKTSVDGRQKPKRVVGDILALVPQSGDGENAKVDEKGEKIGKVGVVRKTGKRNILPVIFLILAILLSVAAIVFGLWQAGCISFDMMKNKGNDLSSLSTGDLITFGSIEQDGDTSNGKEPIEWRIVDVDGDKALAVSVHSLMYMPYNDRNAVTTWEGCTLREWLNNDFYFDGFTDDERRNIVLADNANPRNQHTDVNGGGNTDDYVFCLEIKQVEQYFPTTEDRCCTPTLAAMLETYGVKTASVGDQWWTRSPGKSLGHAAYVKSLGSIDYFGFQVNIKQVAVRPAIWIYMS